MEQFLIFESTRRGKSCSSIQWNSVGSRSGFIMTDVFLRRQQLDGIAPCLNFDGDDGEKHFLGFYGFKSLSGTSFHVACLFVFSVHTCHRQSGPLGSSSYPSRYLFPDRVLPQPSPAATTKALAAPRRPVNLRPICCSSTRPVGHLRCLGKTEN